ncbi:serine/threonine-protein kinase [Nonomuraea sp. NPDC050310]|uniref:serine/threonine-protein kinase n=1 Tax=Nonomuraea sp. NPDC050310 TaxID=3154935 RepID=UPI0033DE287A
MPYSRPSAGTWVATVVWALIPLVTCGLGTPFAIGFAAFWMRSAFQAVAAAFYLFCVGLFVVVTAQYDDFEMVPEPASTLVTIALVGAWFGGLVHTGILVPLMANARRRDDIHGMATHPAHQRGPVQGHHQGPKGPYGQQQGGQGRQAGGYSAHFGPQHGEPGSSGGPYQGAGHGTANSGPASPATRHGSGHGLAGSGHGGGHGPAGSGHGAGHLGHGSGPVGHGPGHVGHGSGPQGPGSPASGPNSPFGGPLPGHRAGQPGGGGQPGRGAAEHPGRQASSSQSQAGLPHFVGHYKVLESLGRGGQGAVYLAVAPNGTKVAVKVLHELGNETARERFVREVEAARRVATFSTARVLDVNINGPHAYIVSEYVEGPSLEQLVRRQGPRDADSLTRLALSTAGALAAIHKAGIVHRDFKPSNILIGADGPRVIDFGIARALDQVTMTAGRMVGTPPYMSPEQLSGEKVGPPSDVFSWAVTMLFAATGRPAFGEDSVPAVFNRVLTVHPDLSPLPSSLRRVAGACLDKTPENRPSASDVMLAIVD